MIRILFLTALMLFPSLAHADYFLWEHEKTGLTMTYPDTWNNQLNVNPDDILTIAGPSYNGAPKCTVKASDDKRYLIYPAKYGRAVQKDAVSTPFWRTYMGHYDDYTLNKVYDGGGLGRWLASYAYATYDVRKGNVYQKRRALMFASLYYDTMYIIECSALNHEYDRWDRNFRSIIKSIDFDEAFSQWPTGHYDDFLTGSKKYFWTQTGYDGTTGY